MIAEKLVAGKCRTEMSQSQSEARLLGLFLLLLSVAHSRSIVSVNLEIFAELGVLMGDGILSDLGKHECQASGENAQRARNEERVLPAAHGIWSVGFDNREDVGADKGTDFAHGSSDAVVLASDGRRAALGCAEADVVAGSEFTER